MYREVPLATGEYYHVLGRGNNKQEIFTDEYDYTRFLFSVLFFQYGVTVHNLAREVHRFVKSRTLFEQVAVSGKEKVSILAFTFMPNHYHLIVRQNADGAVSAYMQRLLNGYAKYFNTRHERSGHLFQGPFKSVHVSSNEQLLYLSTYLHKNPRELAGWSRRLASYPWSSYQDYIRENRWGGALDTKTILDQFKSSGEYQSFVVESIAKEQ